MTIAERLDALSPAKCSTCDSPLRRIDAAHGKWLCQACGVDQWSYEGASNEWARNHTPSVI